MRHCNVSKNYVNLSALITTTGKIPFHESCKDFVSHGESKLVESPLELFDCNVAFTVYVH